MKPVSQINICSIPELTPDYAHTWRFKDKQEQEDYFLALAGPQLTNYSYIRQDNAIKVFSNIDSLHRYNYLMYKNKHDKWYYCFITKKEYINELTTKLYIQTDLLQTYQFDFELTHSFVDRCHVDRWDRRGNIIKHDEPEDLEFGEYVEFGTRKTLHKYEDSYLIFTSNPLGVIDSRHVPQDPIPPTPQPDPDQPNPDDPDVNPPIVPGGNRWQEGYVSGNLLRFIKGYEAYAPRPYWDSHGKVWTTGYGVTKQGGSEEKAYNYLANRAPASEKDCAVVLNYLIVNNYGKAIVKKLTSLLTKQQEFDAIVSFCYNLGTGYGNPDNTQYSPSLWKAIKAYKQSDTPQTRQKVRDAFELYRNPGTSVEAGLRARRKAEANIFLDGKYEFRTINEIDSNGRPTGRTVANGGWLPK